MLGHAGHKCVEDFADAVLDGHSRKPLRHVALDFLGCAFFRSTIRRDGAQLSIGVGIFLPRQHGFQQTLVDDIDESPVGRGGVSVILDGKTEVSWGNFAGLLQNVFTGANKFNHCERKIREVIGIGGPTLKQEIVCLLYTSRCV